LSDKFGNPSSIYSYGRETRLAIENARKSVAKILNAHPAEIFFTSGGTESSNTAITASVRDLGCTHIITSPLEHHATLHTVEYLKKRGEATVSYVRVLGNGHIDMEHLETLLTTSKEKVLVTLMHANNEIGNITDLHLVGALCQKFDAIFHSDTVQTVGHFPFDLQATPVHFITGAAHKFHGPKGVGLLYIKDIIQIQPYLHGGGQERNMRAGTENVYGIVGFAKALELATEKYEAESAYIKDLKLYLMNRLQNEFQHISVNGDPLGESNYTVLNVSFPKSEKTEMLLMNLDMAGVCASGGSACTSGAQQGSHVIQAINPATDHMPVRFSFCKNNTIAEADQLIELLKQFI
jgi:cysteine desulfurase